MDEHDDLVVALTPLIDVLDRLGVAWYRKCDPSVLRRAPQLVVRRYRGRRQRQRPALFAYRVCEGERARALRLPAPCVHRVAQGANAYRDRSPATDPSRPCRPGATLPPRVLPRRTSIAPLRGRLLSNTLIACMLSSLNSDSSLPTTIRSDDSIHVDPLSDCISYSSSRNS